MARQIKRMSDATLEKEIAFAQDAVVAQHPTTVGWLMRLVHERQAREVPAEAQSN